MIEDSQIVTSIHPLFDAVVFMEYLSYYYGKIAWSDKKSECCGLFILIYNPFFSIVDP